MVAPLMDSVAEENPKSLSQISVIKRGGCGYMQIAFEDIVFKDFINFSAPIRLGKFAKSCDVTEIKKALFPYEKYHSILEMEAAEDFPAYKDFRSSISDTDGGDFAHELKFLIEKNIRGGVWEDLLDVEDFFHFEPGYLEKFLTLEQEHVILEDQDGLAKILHSCPNVYYTSRVYFDENCRNMKDYLSFYNTLGNDENYC